MVFSWKRLLPLLLAALATPPAAWFAGRAEAEHRQAQQRLIGAQQAAPSLSGIRERLDTWPTLRGEIDRSIDQAGQRGWRYSFWGQRQLVVDNRKMTRREADAYLQSIRGGEENFFLVDSFALLATNAEYGLYAPYHDEARAGPVVLTLKGRLYARERTAGEAPKGEAPVAVATEEEAAR